MVLHELRITIQNASHQVHTFDEITYARIMFLPPFWFRVIIFRAKVRVSIKDSQDS